MSSQSSQSQTMMTTSSSSLDFSIEANSMMYHHGISVVDSSLIQLTGVEKPSINHFNVDPIFPQVFDDGNNCDVVPQHTIEGRMLHHLDEEVPTKMHSNAPFPITTMFSMEEAIRIHHDAAVESNNATSSSSSSSSGVHLFSDKLNKHIVVEEETTIYDEPLMRLTWILFTVYIITTTIVIVTIAMSWITKTKTKKRHQRPNGNDIVAVISDCTASSCEVYTLKNDSDADVDNNNFKKNEESTTVVSSSSFGVPTTQQHEDSVAVVSVSTASFNEKEQHRAEDTEYVEDAEYAEDTEDAEDTEYMYVENTEYMYAEDTEYMYAEDTAEDTLSLSSTISNLILWTTNVITERLRGGNPRPPVVVSSDISIKKDSDAGGVLSVVENDNKKNEESTTVPVSVSSFGVTTTQQQETTQLKPYIKCDDSTMSTVSNYFMMMMPESYHSPPVAKPRPTLNQQNLLDKVNNNDTPTTAKTMMTTTLSPPSPLLASEYLLDLDDIDIKQPTNAISINTKDKNNNMKKKTKFSSSLKILRKLKPKKITKMIQRYNHHREKVIKQRIKSSYMGKIEEERSLVSNNNNNANNHTITNNNVSNCDNNNNNNNINNNNQNENVEIISNMKDVVGMLMPESEIQKLREGQLFICEKQVDHANNTIMDEQTYQI